VWLLAAGVRAQDRVELSPLAGDADGAVRAGVVDALGPRFDVVEVEASAPIAPRAIRVSGRVGRRRGYVVARLNVEAADGTSYRVAGRARRPDRVGRRIRRRLVRVIRGVWRRADVPADGAAGRAARDRGASGGAAGGPAARAARRGGPPGAGASDSAGGPASSRAAGAGTRGRGAGAGVGASGSAEARLRANGARAGARPVGAPAGSAAPGAVADGGRPPSGSLRAGVRLMRRRLSYRDDLFDALSSYELPAAPAVSVEGRYYPLSHLGEGVGAAFGVDLRAAHVLGAESESAAGAVFPTRAYEWQAGLRGRLRLGEHELSLGAAFGEHAFLVDIAAPTRPTNAESNLPSLPDVRYRYVRPDVAARLELGAGVFAELEAGWRFVVDAGAIGSEAWFPRHFASGLDGALRLGVRLTPWLAVGVSARYARYFYDLRPEPGDPHVAGGAVDEYLDASLDVEIRDPGE
jgi:hypothetical protein